MPAVATATDETGEPVSLTARIALHAKAEAKRLLPHEAQLLAVALTRLPAQRARHLKACAATGVEDLATLDLGAMKSADTVFILGSGSSVNRISAARWDSIRAADTFGMGFWVRHPFVPTFYSFETGASWFDGSGQMTDVYRRLLEIFRSRSEYRSVKKVIIRLHHFELGHDLKSLLPPAWREELYAVNAYNLPARDEIECGRAFRLASLMGAFRQTEHAASVFKPGGSVTMWLSLAVRMGYRNIVLCGVDLSDGRYFWETAASEFEDMVGYTGGRGNHPEHVSYLPQPHGCRADTYVYAFEDFVLKPRGIKLYVEDESSALHPRIPVAPEVLYSRLRSG